jgi:hypothetical protein
MKVAITRVLESGGNLHGVFPTGLRKLGWHWFSEIDQLLIVIEILIGVDGSSVAYLDRTR